MESADEVRAHINSLHESVWELAAVAIALRDPTLTDPDQRSAAEQVLIEAGLLMGTPSGTRSAAGLEEAAGDDGARLAAQAAAGILQSAAVLSGVDAWSNQDDEAILAQAEAIAKRFPKFMSRAQWQAEVARRMQEDQRG